MRLLQSPVSASNLTLRRFSVGCLIFTAIWLTACVSSDSENNQLRPEAETAAPVPYPPGEYITSSRTPAAIDETNLALTIKALSRKDHSSIDVLRDEGVIFNLPKGTRMALQPAQVEGARLQTSVVDTVEGIAICTGTIESGERIGAEVALACQGLETTTR